MTPGAFPPLSARLMSDRSILFIDQLFSELATLNPDALSMPRSQVMSRAREVPESAFNTVAEGVLELVEKYNGTPLKTGQRAVLQKFLAAVGETSLRLKLSAGGGDERPPPDSELAGRLLPVRRQSMSQWPRLMSALEIEDELHRAVDACTNRNESVPTALSIAFEVLFAVDPGQAFEWTIERLDDCPGFADPEVLRDLIAVWNSQNEIPSAAGRAVVDLVDDSRLTRFWPGTELQTNRLLRFLALRSLSQRFSSNRADRQAMDKILQRGTGAIGERYLDRWLDSAVERLGRHVASFIACANRVGDAGTPAELRAMARRQLFTDVRAVNSLHPAILVGADLLLKRGDGAHLLALAFLGVDRKHLANWRNNLFERSAQLIRRMFLEDLRDRRTSIDTIRKLCLGDDLLYTVLYMKLDLLTRQFGSVADREAAIKVLAANYASFRERDLLAEKIRAHYRYLTRLLHSDSLRRLVPEDELERMGALEYLPQALSRAAESRRYLEGRRALDTPVEDMCAAELNFEEELRAARASILRNLLHK